MSESCVPGGPSGRDLGATGSPAWADGLLLLGALVRFSARGGGNGSCPANRIACDDSLTASILALPPGGWMSQIGAPVGVGSKTQASRSTSMMVSGALGMPGNWA